MRPLVVILMLTAVGWAEVIVFDANTVIGPGDVYEDVAITSNAHLTMTGGEVTRVLFLTDSATADLNAGAVHTLCVYNSSQSTINGTVVGFCQTYQASKLIIVAGSLSSIRSIQSSVVDIHGGTTTDTTVELYHESVLNVFTLGDIENVSVYDSAIGNAFSGNISGGLVFDKGILNLKGGAIGQIWIEDEGTINLSGGNIEKSIGVFGGWIDKPYKAIHVFGTDLVARPFGGDETFGLGYVSGLWNGGGAFNIDLNGAYPYVVLHEGEDPPAACIAPPQVDLNDDCVIDAADFAALSSQWLTNGLEE